MREFKHLPFFEVKAQSIGRVRTGICCVFGHIDDWGDRVQPGAFAKTISEGRNRVKHLWNHDFSQPPIASIKELREIGRDELPEEVFTFAPDATGGLLVSREYYTDEFSDRIFKAITAGDITEMSFGYDVIRYETATVGEGDMKRDVRELKELSLYDTSDVLWGMNNATLASLKSAQLPPAILLQQLSILSGEFKAGRRNSTSDQILIQQIHDLSTDCGALCTAETENLDETSEEKNAEAVINNTSLSNLKQQFHAMRARNLQL